ncbi:MAG TPA: SagB/ThcOx family dehydrogenase, partial [Candidatus Hydrogenedentes bacterium]|nr:SagB/ThcOx family dehydrogenase [Candidatus Hydrogenedentota bacterium]
MNEINRNRQFMKSEFAVPKAVRSDQSRGVPPPPIQKPYPEGAHLIALPPFDEGILQRPGLLACLRHRRSRRRFASGPLTLDELAFLLWAIQGIDKVNAGGTVSLRPAPSAGARHPFETYLAVNRVEGVEPGVYRYLPLEHQLVFEFAEPELPPKLTLAALGQTFVGTSAVTLLWACIPYRGEWRYNIRAHRVMLMDAGHLCQN